jgi:26S proteasome regulatory subunit N6
MNNSKDDVNGLINGKFGLKYGADSNITAMKEISEAHFNSSIVALSKVFEKFPEEVQGDEVVKNHTKILYNELLEKNLWKIIESYTRVDLAYIANKLSM